MFYYNRTHGNPVQSLKECLENISETIEKQIPSDKLKISLISTTGSSREILGLFTQTEAIFNEILAHSKGTTQFCNDIDTILEIGGQDAKYISLKNQVAIDYAMNEACSAGTGSFLEEAASGDLNITNVEDIGEIAIKDSFSFFEVGEEHEAKIIEAFKNAKIENRSLRVEKAEKDVGGRNRKTASSERKPNVRTHYERKPNKRTDKRKTGKRR